MGLDMYLKAHLYVSGFRHADASEKELYAKLVDAVGLSGLTACDSPSADIRVTVAYWRKANAIHRWFVEHAQDGTDDCDEYYVSREQLVALRETCRKVLEIANVAHGQPVHSGTTWYADGNRTEEHFVQGRAALNGEEIAKILPTQPGFFFGPTDYDEWFLQDVENTVAQIDRALSAPDSVSFYYRASW